MDILALTNSAIDFILYCTMSRQFRVAFQKIFRPKFLDHWTPIGQHAHLKDGTDTQLTHV